MLKYTELLNNMSAKQKISLIADIHRLADEEYAELGIPHVKIVTLEELFAKDGDGLTPYTLARSWNPHLITNVTKNIIERTCEDANVIIIPSPKINLGAEAQLALSEDPLLSSQIAMAFLSAVEQCKKIGIIPDFCLTKKEIANMDLKPDAKALHDFFYEPFTTVLKKSKAQAVIGSISKNEGDYEDFNRTLLRNKERYFTPETDMLCVCKTYDETIAALEEDCIIFSGVEIAIQNAYEQYHTILSAIEKGRASMLNLEEALDHKTAISDQTLDIAVEKVLDFAFRIQQLHEEMNPPAPTQEEVLPEALNQEDLTEYVAKSVEESPIPTEEELTEYVTKHTEETAPIDKPIVTKSVDDEELITLALTKSTVLLKNKNNALPLKPNQPFAIIGDAALVTPKGATASFAEYFLDYAPENCVGVERGYELFEDRSDTLIPPAVALAEKASTVFVFLKPRENGNTAYPCTTLPANQTALISALAKCKCKIIAILASDINVDVTFSGNVDSFLLAPITGKLSAQALVDTLFGRATVGGKLTISFYTSPNKFHKKQRFYKDHGRNEISIFSGYRFYDTQDISIHYPFGFGLKYSPIEISNVSWTSNGLTMTVANKGTYTIDETIEIYLGMEESKLLRPKKELKAFHSLHLKAGKSERITIKTIDFKTYDSASKAKVTEKGSYTLHIGTAVNQIKTTLQVGVNGKVLTGPQPNLSKYLQSKSNIISNQFRLEAKHNKMVNYKNLKNAGFICLAVAILVTLMSITANAPLIPLIIGAVILLGSVALLVASRNLKARVKMEEAALIEKNKKLFEHATTTASDQLEKLFLAEFKFDVTDSALFMEDGEEVYTDSSNAMLNENMSFALAAADFRKSAGENGVAVDGNSAANLIAAFASSKLLIAKTADAETFDSFVNAVANYFNASLFTETITEAHNPNDRLLRVTTEDGSLVSTSVLSALISANEKPQTMHIIYLKNLQVAKISDYLIPYVKYFSNPHSNAEVSPKGSDAVYTIPNNVWFITDLEKGMLVENVPAYMLECATVLPVKHAIGEPIEPKTEFVPITLTDFEYLSERCKAKFSLNEDIWKKIDAVEAFAFKHTSYKIGNKLWLRIENYLSTLLSMDTELPIAIDSALASVILPTLAASLAGKLDKTDKTLIEEIERIFGEDNVQISHEMLVSKA